ncbi:hypothetical protein BX666DRAFT_2029695 [Dichotomocladium elegans]|nr:hypothetical protein BX666DRAFT_2029695 [Dichotomocladium elegans]
MSIRVDPRYICQSAANAIIAEIGPYQVSNDALQTINQFLDEFLGLLVSSSLSLDLSRVKAVVFTLLPSTLGKNAIVEAELEVKTFTETEAIDFDAYERMRQLGTEEPFPLAEVLELLREKCHEFCTLAERQVQLYEPQRNDPKGLVIVPIVAIYVTTVLEHIGEYVLTAIAMTAEHEDTDYIRIKEVFLALIDDVQVGGVFYRMDLREKLERRAQANGYRPRIATPSFIAPSMKHSSIIGSPNHPQNGIGEDMFDVGFDDIDYDENGLNDHLSVSAYSGFSSQQRPMSIMSTSTSNGTFLSSTFEQQQNNKKAYKLFRKEEMPASITSIYDPDGSSTAMDFDDLIRSGDTMKASLTPNRLKSIEIKDQMRDDPPKASWERRSTANLSLSALSSSARNSNRISSPLSLQHIHHHPQKQLPDLTTSPTSRFENPRDPPKPPFMGRKSTSPAASSGKPSQPTATKLANRSPPLSRENSVPVPVPSVSKKTAKKSHSMTRLQPLPVAPTPSISTPSAPAPTIPAPPMPSVSTPAVVPESKTLKPPLVVPVLKPATSAASASATTAAPTITTSTASTTSTTTTITPITIVRTTIPDPIQSKSHTSAAEPGAPAADIITSKKEVTAPVRPTIMRRSSSSSKLSRESLRRKREAAKEQPPPIVSTADREKEEEAAAPAAAAAIRGDPVASASALVTPPTPPSPPPSERSLTDEEIPGAKTKVQEKSEVDEEEHKKIKATPAVAVTEADEKSTSGVGQQPRNEEERAVTPKSSTSSLKTWETMVKGGNTTPPAGRRRRIATDDLPPRPVSSVLDKVMLFERSLDEFAQQHHRQHRASAYIPRRERFLYLQREPGVLERRVASAAGRPRAVDAAIQTDSAPMVPPAKMNSAVGPSKVDSDEEWFLHDDEWEDGHDDQETAVVEWLLGEA